VTYPFTRFLIEGLRNDEGVFFAGMTISQNISVLVLLGGIAFWAWLWKQPQGRYVDSPMEDVPVTIPPPLAATEP
jgi:phosphatidylglycerol:prolipoprotein diacylglycerol transferase